MPPEQVPVLSEPSRWQVIEQRVADETSARQQFVWDLRYIDDLILRDRDADTSGSLEERLYALQDANWNVTAVIDATGGMMQRFLYYPYGRVHHLGYNWLPSSDFYQFNVLFCGYRYEPATGLYHVRHRVYHHVPGTWLQRDPLGVRKDINLYEYCSLRPSFGIDGYGLWW
jgi:RHS repeat-associated protein